MLNKELIKKALEEFTPDAIALVDQMQGDDVNTYSELIESYRSGQYSSAGWNRQIEAVMLQKGCNARLAFALGVARGSEVFGGVKSWN